MYTVINKGDTTSLVKGPMNYYLIVPNDKVNDIQYLEFMWANGGTLNVDGILSRAIKLK